MITLRRVVPAILLAGSLAGAAVYAETTTAPPAAGAPQWHHGHHHEFGMGGMGFVLHKLNLTAEQKASVKTLFTDQKSQFQALHASMKANHEALAATPPTDAGYATLIETAKTNAGTRISLESTMWTNIYQNVLTKPQRESIPGIVAAAQQAREARMEEWKSEHAQPN